MRDSLLKLIEVSIKVIRLLNEASFKVYPYEDRAFVVIKARKVDQPLKIFSEAKGLEFCFYPVDDFIKIRIYESI